MGELPSPTLIQSGLANSIATPVVMSDTGVDLQPSSQRTVSGFFVPGVEGVGPGDSRAGSVIDRIMALDEHAITRSLRDLTTRFSGRYPNLIQLFRENADRVLSRVDPTAEMSEARTLFLGAAFTHEFSIESAALCNPSIVLAPDGANLGQTDAAIRFVMSVRGIGEGHRSSIGFRTGSVALDGQVEFDVAGAFPVTGERISGSNDRNLFHHKLAEVGDDGENASFVLDALPPVFDDNQLRARLDELSIDAATRLRTSDTIANLYRIADSSYAVEFETATQLSERVLWPQAKAERNGMEDARFVRFTDDDGAVTYLATYTAFDGTLVAQHLLQTSDFRCFRVSQMAGPAATGKGLAIFPRKVGGQYVALSRWDRDGNWVSFSDDIRCWTSLVPIQVAEQPWETLQLGNCGSPIETDAGWLVITHGVGPMRTYSIGAVLLDLDDPCRIIARSIEPIITPRSDDVGGYVPNVVYSCGAMVANGNLIIPYGVGDRSIRVATVELVSLLGGMRRM